MPKRPPETARQRAARIKRIARQIEEFLSEEAERKRARNEPSFSN
jgi:hypothetical protein